jgi:hypothetical protein
VIGGNDLGGPYREAEQNFLDGGRHRSMPSELDLGVQSVDTALLGAADGATPSRSCAELVGQT